MMFIILYVLPALFVLKLIDLQRVKNVNLRYQYKFQKLRDSLQMLVIDGRIDKNNPFIPLVDKSIANSSKIFSSLNLWLVSALFLKDLIRKDQKKEDADQIISSKLTTNKNSMRGSGELLAVLNQNKELPYQYLKETSRFSYVLFAYLFHFLALLNKNFKPSAIRDSIQNIISTTRERYSSFSYSL